MAKVAIIKFAHTKSIFNAIDTALTVKVREEVGVDGSRSTNITSGTCTDTKCCCFATVNITGGPLGFVTPLAVACTAY